MPSPLSRLIAKELNLTEQQVENVINLLQEGASIPFIARYRKELTGSLNELSIIAIRDRLKQLTELEKRRDSVIHSVREQGKLTEELEQALRRATTLTEIEDLYLPFRPKRKTRASMAIEKGLEPLAKIILAQKEEDILRLAKRFIDVEKGVENEDEALQGARDVIAEWVNQDAVVRQRLRRLFRSEAVIASRLVKGKDEEAQKYRSWFHWEEEVRRIPSHRLMAILRGEAEGYLKVEIQPSLAKALEIIERIYMKARNMSSAQVRLALYDAYKRLLQPSLETEIRSELKLKADIEAIGVFSENLRQLLLAPPLRGKNVLAIDPGFRTGCKVVCLDQHGNLLHNETIYPHPPENKVKESMHKIKNLVNAYKIDAIAIGNGTAGRETERFIRHIPFEKDIIAIVVNEAGASIYSVSDIAREEFPDYDVTVRGAVSIGRRLIDPLAELVKIDPKSIGVGQYQHDVDQKMLQESLHDVVESCVNSVGVDVNHASKELLTYISGIGPVLAKNIIEYRKENGPFPSRQQLLEVPRLGAKAFEQSAGFLRIPDAPNPLDTSAVHPESYPMVEAMAAKLGVSVNELIQNKELQQSINIEDFVTEKCGIPTLTDIMKELAKPGRDPRVNFDFFEFDKNVHQIEDLTVGMILPGIVTNITRFGVFVDIGVHQNGLVHISQLSKKYITDPSQVVLLNQKVKVKVLEVDIARSRISLSMKDV
ncbi:MAG: RNA-binding transcriptional accessory protein [Bacteroidales bacterium]|nr:RNA-binding transcriptional accessory protein [Bacteroidales bacterium]NMD15438.1 RNA-binding transcriptional accessory protein [Bacteroidales bacterium]HRC66860.1 Tex family protein [Bacteroidales bacterium]